ncbi:uncharacterized protein [Henckelia pumila]|uniref:uncharacterized protein isoform X2 n=1 Tax=Henckelia pumila TaxID=405737 RepID=UPI003C6DE850
MHFAEGNVFHRRKPISGDLYVNNLDSADVFGGPPRTILFRQPTARSTFTNLFYEQIFGPHDVGRPVAEIVGRRLPEFKIPVRSDREHYDQRETRFDGFYHDAALEWEDQTTVRSRSCSPPVLSSEELILPRTAASGGGGANDVSTFSAKLRFFMEGSKSVAILMGSIFRPTNRKKTTSLLAKEVDPREQNRPPFSSHQQIYSSDSEDDCFENPRNYTFGSSRTNATPETISLDPISNCSFGESEADSELNSPSSKYCPSSHSDQRHKANNQEEDEANSSIVIETSSDDRRDMCEPNDIDEAIAWAKQKFQTSKWDIPLGSNQENQTEETPSRSLLSEGSADGHGSQNKSGTEEETKQLQILDEKIRVWSTGKEADIRLLLSTLHHILWPNSGWFAISLTNLIQRTQVKKAYQRARLCLHPDKLQQRDATLAQKYISQKAFSILQDAWTAFISLQVC